MWAVRAGFFLGLGVPGAKEAEPDTLNCGGLWWFAGEEPGLQRWLFGDRRGASSQGTQLASLRGLESCSL